MKTIFFTHLRLSYFILCIFLTISCSKSNDSSLEPRQEEFNIHKLKDGYFLYVKKMNADSTNSEIELYEFLSENLIQYYSVEGEQRLSYSIVDENSIETQEGTRFYFDGQNVISNIKRHKDVVLIKNPETDQLSGMNYFGQLYDSHKNLFNTTRAIFNDEKVEINPVNKIVLRRKIGNFATIFVDNGISSNNTYFMVLVNGNLETNMYVKEFGLKTHGTFYKFDINIFTGYTLFGKNAEGQIALYNINAVFEQLLVMNGIVFMPYIIFTAENRFEINSPERPKFIVDGKTVHSDLKGFEELALIKNPIYNQLEGKTFIGTYYKANGDVLHPNFFYTFTNYQVSAGLKLGTVIRTKNYIAVNSIVCYNLLANGDIETMALINGKLEVNYYDKANQALYHGSFTQQ